MKPSDLLFNCRTNLGWSRLKLSIESGVSKNTIEEIENNRRGGRIDTFIKLLHAMGYKLEVKKINERSDN